MSKQHATKRRLATDSKHQVPEANDSNAFDSMQDMHDNLHQVVIVGAFKQECNYLIGLAWLVRLVCHGT